MTDITNGTRHDLGNILMDYFDGCDRPIFIISPFIENSALVKLLSYIETDDVSIITSWRFKDLRAGVSSLDLYDLVKDNSWTLYINNNLHAKIYSISFDSCYMGSMNCTNRALFNQSGNIECYHFKDEMDTGNRIELNRIIASSTLVDDRVYLKYLDWFKDCDIDDSKEVVEPFIDDISPFYIHQLPLIENPFDLWNYVSNPSEYVGYEGLFEHDLAIYTDLNLDSVDESEFIESLKRNFITHPFISKINEMISPSGTRFGEFRIKVRDICTDVPMPCTYELNDSVHNLYRWFLELFPEKYRYDIPGKRSEVLYRLDEQIR